MQGLQLASRDVRMKTLPIFFLFVAVAQSHVIIDDLAVQSRWDCPSANGIFPDPADCSMFYACANGKPFHEACGKDTLFHDVTLICDRPENVDCGDRPIPGSTTTSTTPSTSPTSPTTTTPYTGPSTTSTTTTTTTGTPPVPGPMPNKVIAFYILLADDTVPGFESDADWTPELFDWQQTAANVLFFTFINPTDMRVPPAYINLAKTRGTGAKGSVPADTKILFAIGGYEYSLHPNPWPFLTSPAAAEAMAAEVAKWPELYGCDGIDLDIEEGAGSSHEAGANMVHFVQTLKKLNPDIVVTQPSYGCPSIAAEVDVINASWEKDGTSKNLAYSVGK